MTTIAEELEKVGSKTAEALRERIGRQETYTREIEAERGLLTKIGRAAAAPFGVGSRQMTPEEARRTGGGQRMVSERPYAIEDMEYARKDVGPVLKHLEKSGTLADQLARHGIAGQAKRLKDYGYAPSDAWAAGFLDSLTMGALSNPDLMGAAALKPPPGGIPELGRAGTAGGISAYATASFAGGMGPGTIWRGTTAGLHRAIGKDALAAASKTLVRRVGLRAAEAALGVGTIEALRVPRPGETWGERAEAVGKGTIAGAMIGTAFGVLGEGLRMLGQLGVSQQVRRRFARMFREAKTVKDQQRVLRDMRKAAYKHLGLRRGAKEAEIKEAYRTAAKRTHPDVPGGEAEAFQDATRAYDFLRGKTAEFRPTVRGPGVPPRPTTPTPTRAELPGAAIAEPPGRPQPPEPAGPTRPITKVSFKPGQAVRFVDPKTGKPTVGRFEAIQPADSPTAGLARVRIGVTGPLRAIDPAALQPHDLSALQEGQKVELVGFPASESPATVLRTLDDGRIEVVTGTRRKMTADPASVNPVTEGPAPAAEPQVPVERVVTRPKTPSELVGWREPTFKRLARITTPEGIARAKVLWDQLQKQGRAQLTAFSADDQAILREMDQSGVAFINEREGAVMARGTAKEPLAQPIRPFLAGVEPKPHEEVVAELKERAKKPIDVKLKLGEIPPNSRKMLAKFAKEVPVVVLDPVLTVGTEDGNTVLIFRDDFRFVFKPEALGLQPADLKQGQRIGMPLAKLPGITTSALQRAAEKPVIAKPAKKPPKLLARPPAPPKPGKDVTLAAAMKAMAPMRAKMPSHYAMNTFGVDKNHLLATDGHRVFILERPGIAEKLKVKLDKQGNPVGITDSGKAVEGGFPQYRDVVPSIGRDTIAATIDPARAWRDVRKAMRMLPEDSKAVNIHLNEDGTIGFSVRGVEVGEANINVQSDALALGTVDGKMLRELFEAHLRLGSKQVDLHWMKPDSPFALVGSHGDTSVMMPIDPQEGSATAEQIAKWKGKPPPTEPPVKPKPAPPAAPEGEPTPAETNAIAAKQIGQVPKPLRGMMEWALESEANQSEGSITWKPNWRQAQRAFHWMRDNKDKSIPFGEIKRTPGSYLFDSPAGSLVVRAPQHKGDPWKATYGTQTDAVLAAKEKIAEKGPSLTELAAKKRRDYMRMPVAELVKLAEQRGIEAPHKKDALADALVRQDMAEAVPPAPEKPAKPEAKEYVYESQLRPVSTAALPSDYRHALIRMEDGGQFGRAVYSEPLPAEVIEHFSLKLIEAEPAKPTAIVLREAEKALGGVDPAEATPEQLKEASFVLSSTSMKLSETDPRYANVMRALEFVEQELQRRKPKPVEAKPVKPKPPEKVPLPKYVIRQNPSTGKYIVYGRTKAGRITLAEGPSTRFDTQEQAQAWIDAQQKGPQAKPPAKRPWEKTLDQTELPAKADKTKYLRAVQRYAAQIKKAVQAGEAVPVEVLSQPVIARQPWAKGAIGRQENEPASEFVPGAAPTDVEHIVIDEFRDWPVELKEVGEDFWTILMGAAKKLLTPYRYKALRKTVLGTFGPGRGIAAQDVTDALTGVHELGHNIDWLLNEKSFPSSIVKRFAGAEHDKALRAELAKVSGVLRPDLWGEGVSKYMKGYVRRHAELMADFYSLYILDPEMTAELAPKMTGYVDAHLARYPEIKQTIQDLRARRFDGPDLPPVAEHIHELMPLRDPLKPLRLVENPAQLEDPDYVRAAEELGIRAQRQQRMLLQRAKRDAARVRKLAPGKSRREDLRVLAEGGQKNPRTGHTAKEIEASLTPDERKALELFRGYQERGRQTVNKYLRGADVAEYIKFIDDYFLHRYRRPMSTDERVWVAKWIKRSPQAKKRILPTLEEAEEMGLEPVTYDLADGLEIWGEINYRVATNLAFLRILPKIKNASGESIIQKPDDKPEWPKVDYWPIRMTYARPLEKGRGILLVHGRVAVDPEIEKFVHAMFGTWYTGRLARTISGINATLKAFEVTLFSLFHHVEETLSGIGAIGLQRMLVGFWGREAALFGETVGDRILLKLPVVGALYAGKQLSQVPAFVDDYIEHGGQLGKITGEGITQMERMLASAETCLRRISQGPGAKAKLAWPTQFPIKGTKAVYGWWQRTLWDNVERLKLLSYYEVLQDGLDATGMSMKRIKELAATYVNNNFGGQEWLATRFADPKTQWWLFNLFLAFDWTYGQVKTPFWAIGRGVGARTKAERQFAQYIGLKHWLRYGAAFLFGTQILNLLFAGKLTWQNEPGRKWDVDWTDFWRQLPWNRDWKERGDTTRRYFSMGKAAREAVRWVTEPLREFGNKLSPLAKLIFEQSTGMGVGNAWGERWVKQDLEWYDETWERFKNVAEKFKPFSFSGNNAFLAFPSRKGMTYWKARKAFEELYRARAEAVAGGVRGRLARWTRALMKDAELLRWEIREACKINEIDPDKVERVALGETRTRYYSKFIWAAKDGDWEACNRWADVLAALGVTMKGAAQSMIGRDLPVEIERKAWSILGERLPDSFGHDQMLALRVYSLTDPKLPTERHTSLLKFLKARGVTAEKAEALLREAFVLRKLKTTKTMLQRMSRLRQRWESQQAPARRTSND